MNKSLFLLIFLILSGHLFSQETDSISKKKGCLKRMDSISNWKMEHGRSTLVPFAAPSYTPETSVMLTAGGLYTFKMNQEDKLLSRSSVPFSFDIHAMIHSENAPRLEKELHEKFHTSRVNKLNRRQEFFKIPLTHIKQKINELELNTH